MSLRHALARLPDFAGVQPQIARQAFREVLDDILNVEFNRGQEPRTARC